MPGAETFWAVDGAHGNHPLFAVCMSEHVFRTCGLSCALLWEV